MIPKYLKANFRLPDPAFGVAQRIQHWAEDLVVYSQASDCRIQDREQWDLGFQKLLEAKDCFVRALLDPPK